MYVYVIKSNIKNKGVKIGHSDEPNRRLKQIQSDSSGGDPTCHFLILIESTEAQVLEERYLHKFFDKFNKKYTLDEKDTNYIKYQEWFDLKILNQLVAYIYCAKANNICGIKNIIFYENTLFSKQKKYPFITTTDIYLNKYLSPTTRRKIYIQNKLNLYTSRVLDLELNTSEIKNSAKQLFNFYQTFKQYIDTKKINCDIFDCHIDKIDKRFEYESFLSNIIFSSKMEHYYIALKKMGTFNMLLYFEYIELYLHETRAINKELNITKQEKKLLSFCLKYKADIQYCYNYLLEYVKKSTLQCHDKSKAENIYYLPTRIEETKRVLESQEESLLTLSGLLTDIAYFEKRKQHVWFNSRKEWYADTRIYIECLDESL